MRPHPDFLNETPEFWALAKYSSEQLGYSPRVSYRNPHPVLRRYTDKEIGDLANQNGLDDHTAQRTRAYLNYRADLLEKQVQPLLMDRDEAERIFADLCRRHNPTCNLPLNKQTKEKKHHAYFTCIINILTELHLRGGTFNDNPGQLATITDPTGRLIKVLSRRIDGAYPGLQNPKAIWEVKEYYGTTTFGSRVADGVYETQLDGYELSDIERLISHSIEHYLLVDDSFTWWTKGRSYLCRLIDITHEGLVTEVIFGKEVLDRWPQIVESWL